MKILNNIIPVSPSSILRISNQTKTISERMKVNRFKVLWTI